LAAGHDPQKDRAMIDGGGVWLRVAVFIGLAALSANAQTRELLDAPTVQSRIRVRMEPGTQEISFAVDDDGAFRKLPPRPIFRTKQSIAVTYPQFNPLRVHAAVSPPAAGEPAIPRALPLVEALVAASSVMVRGARPTMEPPVPPGDCSSLEGAARDANLLARALYGEGQPATVGGMLDGWRAAIDARYRTGASGPEAVGAAASAMLMFGREMTSAIEAAAPLVSRLEQGTPPAPAADWCDAAARYLADTLRLINPRGRLQELMLLNAIVGELREMLVVDYVEGAGSNWSGSEYTIGTALAKSDESVRLALTIDAVDYDVNRGSVTLRRGSRHGAATLELRRSSRFVREFGLGTALSSIVRPKYGTSSDGDGRTVVARLKPGLVSFAPVMVANFTCLCDTGPFVTPMLQTGLSTSPDGPGLLAGGGARLFGVKGGDVAVGAGWMIAWVHDLKSLREGSQVGGTRDIEADLGFVRRTGSYLLFQYKF
jgi:hypothetical protein